MFAVFSRQSHGSAEGLLKFQQNGCYQTWRISKRIQSGAKQVFLFAAKKILPWNCWLYLLDNLTQQARPSLQFTWKKVLCSRTQKARRRFMNRRNNFLIHWDESELMHGVALSLKAIWICIDNNNRFFFGWLSLLGPLEWQESKQRGNVQHNQKQHFID